MEEALGVIGIPTLENMPSATFRSYAGVEKPTGTALVSPEGIPTHMARNKIVAYVLEHKSAEWLFFMDSDMVFPAKALKHLLGLHLPVVGGAYFQRFFPFNLTAYRYQGKDDKGRFQYVPLTEAWLALASDHRTLIPIDQNFGGTILRQLTGSIPNSVIPVDAIGTGCLLIRREVLGALTYPYFSYDEDGSEDLFFCRKVKAAGYDIHLDMSLICGHITRQVVGPVQCLSAHGMLVQKSQEPRSNGSPKLALVHKE